MMESDCGLDQGLKKLSVGFGSVPPEVFEDFVAFEERRLIEQGNSSKIWLGIHLAILAQK
jgi:hypothetical protein